MKTSIAILYLATLAVVGAHTLRFVAFDLQVPAGKCQLIPASDPAKPIAVDVGISRFSDAVQASKGIYQLVLPDGKTKGNLTLPGDTEGRWIIIVTPGPGDSVGIIPIPDETSKFGPGDRLFINATRSEIRMQLGEQKVICKSGTTKLLPAPKIITEGRFPVRMAVLKNDEWLFFNSTWWPADEVARSIIALFPNAVTGIPMVKTIEEIPVK